MQCFDLHLMRHGAPEVPHLMLGRTDARPDAAGVAACRARAAGLAVEAIVASDLTRALSPAQAIAKEKGLSLTIDPRWRELDFGAWDGLRPDEIDPAALGLFWDDPDASPPPHGESWSALLARVTAALTALPPRPTLVVAHGGSMRAALAHLCKVDRQAAFGAFDLPYGALLSLRVWPGAAAQVTGLTA